MFSASLSSHYISYLYLLKMDFKTAYEELLSLTGRPANSDWIPVAKTAIRHAQTWAQRSHNFKMLETFGGFTYPKDAKTVDITSICDGTIKTVLDAMLVEDHTSEFWGIPLELENVRSITDRLRDLDHDQRQFFGLDSTNIQRHEHMTYLVHNRPAHRAFKFFMTGNCIGLYPVPSESQEISLYFIKWLPDLSADTDTNFLLDFGWDFLSYKALQFFNTFLKEDARVQVSEALLNRAWMSLVEWDSELSGGTFPVKL